MALPFLVIFIWRRKIFCIPVKFQLWTDPFAGRLLDISNVTDTTFEVNVGVSPDTSTHTFKSAAPGGLIHKDNTVTIDVGKAPLQGYDISNATYDPSNGNLVLTVGTHNLTAGEVLNF